MSSKLPIPILPIPYAAILGVVLQSKRILKGLTQTNVAAYLELQQSAVSKIEKGMINIQMNNFSVLCSFLDLKPSAIIKEVEDIRDRCIESGYTISYDVVTNRSSQKVLYGRQLEGALFFLMLEHLKAEQKPVSK